MPVEADDYQPVRHTGGKVTFRFVEIDGTRRYSVGWEHATPFPAALFAIYALVPDGLPLAMVPLGGIGSTMPPPPASESLLVFIGSDREGLFGRSCPSCRRYFRTGSAGQNTRCPYCGILRGTYLFLTDLHRSNYIRLYVDRFLDAYERGEDTVVDLDALADEVGANATPSPLSEQRQQTKFRCQKCGTMSDIEGRYGYCPSCGRRNSFALLSKALDGLEDRIRHPRYLPEEREMRDAEWRAIVRDCVSAFEGYGRDLTERLATIPATPSRRASISKIAFHAPTVAADRIQAFFDIDLLNGINAEEREFLTRRFLRRHVYEHCSGIADRDYIDASGDSVRLGQLLRERSNSVATLVALTRKMAQNFDEGFHSIGAPCGR